MTDTTHAISKNFAVLANGDRREMLRVLTRSPSATCTVDELVASLADRWEDGQFYDCRERARIRLYHVDLPALKDAGLVEYDWRSGDVSMTVDSDATATLLERLKGAEWPANDFSRSPTR